MNFFTGKVGVTGSVTMDSTEIVQGYLLGWFWLDLISSIPYELIMLAASADRIAWGHPILVSSFQLLQIFRLVKITRIVRLAHVFGRWERSLILRHSVSAVAKYAVGVVLVSHWLACLFFFVGKSEFKAGRESWVQANDLVDGTATLSDQYVFSLYYSLTSTTTTGFGDIAAQSTRERIVAALGMVIGTGIFSFGLTSVLVIF